MDRGNHYRIDYHFELLQSGKKKDFRVVLSKTDLEAVSPEESHESEWTSLDFHKCATCPLDSATTPNCPIAYNISGLASDFADIFSTEEALIRVDVAERSYIRRDSAQVGLRSILGLYMAASGCPHMAILRPMTRFHLPFASMEETLFRHISSYLLDQFFEYQETGRFDLALSEYAEKTERVRHVNIGMHERLLSIAEADANRNAIVSLSSIGLMVDLEIQAKFDSLRYLYRKA